MQTGETVCLWKYQFRNNEQSLSSPMNQLASAKKKGTIDSTIFFNCQERRACADEMSSKATFFCAQCRNLQCAACEEDIHRQANMKNHQRLNLDEMDDEFCSVDRSHQAVFYCPSCAAAFCYKCFNDQHQYLDKKEHRPQKCREGQTFLPKPNT